MMEQQHDPEVEADLRLRASSLRDQSRTREARYDWLAPAFVGQWRCRNPKCGAWVPVTEDALHAAATFNQQLRRKGEEPLDLNGIVFCEPCREEFRRTAADRRRAQVERMRAAIIELKSCRNPERQRMLVEQLRIWYHPDVDGLVQWMRERDSVGNGRRKDL